MVAGNSVEMIKGVKIRAKRPIRLEDGSVLQPGSEASVSEEMAKEYCDRQFTTQYEFSGERAGIQPLPQITRAERVSTRL